MALALRSLPMRLRPWQARIAQKLTHPGLARMATQQIELCPATPKQVPPAVALPGMFDRVLGFDSTTDFATQNTYLNAPMDQNGPTTALLLENALLTTAGIFHSRGMFPLREDAPRGFVKGEIAEQDEGMLCTSWVVERYFGHWLREGLHLEMLAQDQGHAPITLPARPWLHESGYRALAALQAAPVAGPTRFKRLWVIDDRALNEGRAARMRRLRDTVRATLAGGGPERVFLRRGSSGTSRPLVNEPDVIARLQAEGFAICAPETSSAAEITAMLASARIVAGVEGSAITHTTTCLPAGAALLVIQPPHRFNAMARPFGAALGHRYSFTVADPHPKGFAQNIDELLATLDLVEAAIATAS